MSVTDHEMKKAFYKLLCAISNDTSSRVVSLEASRHCLCSHRVVSLEASRHCLCSHRVVSLEASRHCLCNQ